MQDREPLVCLRTGNPYRRSTKAWLTYEMFKQCATVGEARQCDRANPDRFDIGYLHYASRDGYIKVGT